MPAAAQLFHNPLYIDFPEAARTDINHVAHLAADKRRLIYLRSKPLRVSGMKRNAANMGCGDFPAGFGKFTLAGKSRQSLFQLLLTAFRVRFLFQFIIVQVGLCCFHSQLFGQQKILRERIRGAIEEYLKEESI